MSKEKAIYLKIEDWDSLRSAILANVVDCSGSADSLMKIMSELGKHKINVIGFEAEVKLKSEPHIYKEDRWFEDRLVAYIEMPMEKNIVWRIKDKLQVFVLKPKKPEVKDEKDKT